MTRFLGLVLLLSLTTASAAWARSYGAHHPRMHVARSSPHVHTTHVRRARKPSLHHRSKLASLAASRSDDRQPRDTSRFQDAAAGPSDRPGLFKGQHEAGWGFHNDRMTTVVGLYQRPENPGGGPANQVYDHDSRGAAGLSLSFKLGQ